MAGGTGSVEDGAELELRGAWFATGQGQWLIHFCVCQEDRGAVCMEGNSPESFVQAFVVKPASTQLYAVKCVQVMFTYWVSAASLTMFSSLTAEGARDC